eukprot:scaffold97368_cov27-Tisochrysis_lutea.AAC.1
MEERPRCTDALAENCTTWREVLAATGELGLQLRLQHPNQLQYGDRGWRSEQRHPRIHQCNDCHQSARNGRCFDWHFIRVVYDLGKDLPHPLCWFSSAEPASAETASAQPASAESASAQPASAQAALVEPALVEPASVQPASGECEVPSPAVPSPDALESASGVASSVGTSDSLASAESISSNGRSRAWHSSPSRQCSTSRSQTTGSARASKSVLANASGMVATDKWRCGSGPFSKEGKMSTMYEIAETSPSPVRSTSRLIVFSTICSSWESGAGAHSSPIQLRVYTTRVGSSGATAKVESATLRQRMSSSSTDELDDVISTSQSTAHAPRAASASQTPAELSRRAGG